MKHILLSITAAVFVLFAISGCHKSGGVSHGTMTATVNGQPFSSSHCAIGSFIAASGTIKGLNIVGFTGSNYDPPDISFSIANFVTGSTGTYTIVNDSSLLVFASMDSTINSGTLAQSGTITINSSSTSAISGTFSFILADGTTITNGVFTAVE